MKKQDIYKKIIKDYIEKCVAEDKITISDIANHILSEKKYIFKKNKISINYKTIKRTIADIFSFDYNLDYFGIEIDYIKKHGAVNKKVFKKKNVENKQNSNLINDLDSNSDLDLDYLLLDDDDVDVDNEIDLDKIFLDELDNDINFIPSSKNKESDNILNKNKKNISYYKEFFEEFENVYFYLNGIEKMLLDYKLEHEFDDVILKNISLIKANFSKIENNITEIDECFNLIEKTIQKINKFEKNYKYE